MHAHSDLGDRRNHDHKGYQGKGGEGRSMPGRGYQQGGTRSAGGQSIAATHVEGIHYSGEYIRHNDRDPGDFLNSAISLPDLTIPPPQYIASLSHAKYHGRDDLNS